MGGLTSIGVTLALVVVAYLVGGVRERNHYRSIVERETRYRAFPVSTFETLLPGWKPQEASLVSGSVVVSLDYFKRTIGVFRSIFGGRLRTYEPLLDRARREAVLRMIESAKGRGFDAVINVRLETSRLASARRDAEGTAGVEMVAYGTGLKLANAPAAPRNPELTSASADEVRTTYP